MKRLHAAAPIEALPPTRVSVLTPAKPKSATVPADSTTRLAAAYGVRALLPANPLLNPLVVQVLQDVGRQAADLQHSAEWRQANSRNVPYLEYDPRKGPPIPLPTPIRTVRQDRQMAGIPDFAKMLFRRKDGVMESMVFTSESAYRAAVSAGWKEQSWLV